MWKASRTRDAKLQNLEAEAMVGRIALALVKSEAGRRALLDRYQLCCAKHDNSQTNAKLERVEGLLEAIIEQSITSINLREAHASHEQSSSTVSGDASSRSTGPLSYETVIRPDRRLIYNSEE